MLCDNIHTFEKVVCDLGNTSHEQLLYYYYTVFKSKYISTFFFIIPTSSTFLAV